MQDMLFFHYPSGVGFRFFLNAPQHTQMSTFLWPIFYQIFYIIVKLPQIDCFVPQPNKISYPSQQVKLFDVRNSRFARTVRAPRAKMYPIHYISYHKLTVLRLEPIKKSPSRQMKLFDVKNSRFARTARPPCAKIYPFHIINYLKLTVL